MTAETPTETSAATHKRRRFIRWEKIGPAFWTIASLISMTVNIILVVLLLSIGRQLFSLKHLVRDQVLGGLYENFVLMDQAHIRTTIPVSTQVPAKFNLPLDTKTTVTLTENTRITDAILYDLNAGNILTIQQAGLDIVLPAGTNLPVALKLNVPVNQKIPVKLMVTVDIPLNKTELHKPFVGLRNVVEPYYQLLDETPSTWQEVICGPDPSSFCLALIH